jgi:hypothetical protein
MESSKTKALAGAPARILAYCAGGVLAVLALALQAELSPSLPLIGLLIALSAQVSRRGRSGRIGGHEPAASRSQDWLCRLSIDWLFEGASCDLQFWARCPTEADPT